MSDPTIAMYTLMEKVEKNKKRFSVNGWMFREGIRWAANPKYRCPNCNGMFDTNRIWIWDEIGQKLKGCFHMDGKEVSNSGASAVHPHVSWPTGTFCMGNAKKISDIMFLGVNTGRHHRPTDIWVASMGHHCPNSNYSHCIICDHRHLYALSKLYGLKSTCSEICYDVAYQIKCCNCGTDKDPLLKRSPEESQKYQLYCNTCFPICANTCFECGTQMVNPNLRVYGYRTLCLECNQTRTGSCSHCAEATPYRDLDIDRCCPKCTIVSCSHCTRRIRAINLIDGRCSMCRPKKCLCGVTIPGTMDQCDRCHYCWRCGVILLEHYEDRYCYDCRNVYRT